MENLSMYKENKDFEQVVSNFYGDDFCDRLIEWTDALRYRFIKIDSMGEFELWESDSFDNDIANNTGKIVTINEVVIMILEEIDIVLDEFKGVDDKDLSEEDRDRKQATLADYNILENAKPNTLSIGTLVNIKNENTIGRIEGFCIDEFKYMVEPLNTDFTQNLFYVYPDEIETVKQEAEYTLILKENNLSIKEICPICKNEFKNTMPIGTFIKETDSSVCQDCAKTISEDIVGCLNIYLSTKK